MSAIGSIDISILICAPGESGAAVSQQVEQVVQSLDSGLFDPSSSRLHV